MSSEGIIHLKRILSTGLILLGLLSASLQETIADFEGGYFKIQSRNKGIYPLSAGIGSADSDGNILMAYADLNGDSYTDIITMTSDRKKIKIFTYSTENSKNVF